MRTPLWAFFHCWADGEWQGPTEDFAHSVDSSGLGGILDGKFLGLVGTPENRQAAADYMGEWTPIVQADEGYTQVTLAALRKFAHEGHDGYVLYAHNKGAMNNTPINTVWRRSMFRRCIENWREVIPLLEDHDAAGCHWLTPEQFPSMSFSADLPAPRHFGGEVWWARLDYLRKLPPLRYETRWDSEPWIGYCDEMRPYDLLPGWPSIALCS